jgi:hypothetical protein
MRLVERGCLVAEVAERQPDRFVVEDFIAEGHEFSRGPYEFQRATSSWFTLLLNDRS